jgi:hypothetical protein
MDRKDAERRARLEEENEKKKLDSEIKRMEKQQKIEEVKKREEQLL